MIKTMSIYKEELEYRFSHLINEFKTVQDTQGFWSLGYSEQIEIRMGRDVFTDFLSYSQNLQSELLLLVHSNSNIIGVPHILDTTDEYLNYLYNKALERYEDMSLLHPEVKKVAQRVQNKLLEMIRSVEYDIDQKEIGR